MADQKYRILPDKLLDTYMSQDPLMPKGHFSSQSILSDEEGAKLYAKYPHCFHPVKEEAQTEAPVESTEEKPKGKKKGK